MIASLAMVLTISWSPCLDGDAAKTSAPCMASARVLASVSRANFSLYGFIPRATLVDDALGIDHRQVLGLHAEEQVEIGAGDAGGAGAAEHHLDLVDGLADELAAVEQGGAGDDGRPCWSSWKTGMPIVRLSSSSISKHSAP